MQVNTLMGEMSPGDYLRTVATTLSGADSLTAIGTANILDLNFQDQEADVKQTGSELSYIFGINMSLTDELSVGFRYEMLTSLELENDTRKDFVIERDPKTGEPTATMFPDSAKTHSDMPAMLALGVSYQAMDKLHSEFGFNYCFNKDVNWNGREQNVDNGYEIGIALEYKFS